MGKRLTAQKSTEISLEICSLTPVIPVLSVFEVEDAIPLGKALVDGGLNVIEVTLRTANALKVIEEMSKVNDSIVGVGTLLSKQDVENAARVGAKFGVSPGITEGLVDACEENGLPLLGGVSSTSEIMKMLDRGYRLFKFFPAEASGGANALKAIGAPIPHALFCPTGGVSLENINDYMALENVVCVGGSWIATPEMIRYKKWSEIFNQANYVSKLGL